MRRHVLLAALLLAATPALAAWHAAAARANTYCSPTGDYCQAARLYRGHIELRFTTFSLRGSMRVCVRSPRNNVECHTFRLRDIGHSLYEVRVLWSRHFDSDGAGRYRVAFYQGGYRFGQVLHFTVR